MLKKYVLLLSVLKTIVLFNIEFEESIIIFQHLFELFFKSLLKKKILLTQNFWKVVYFEAKMDISFYLVNWIMKSGCSIPEQITIYLTKYYKYYNIKWSFLEFLESLIFSRYSRIASAPKPTFFVWNNVHRIMGK